MMQIYTKIIDGRFRISNYSFIVARFNDYLSAKYNFPNRHNFEVSFYYINDDFKMSFGSACSQSILSYENKNYIMFVLEEYLK